MGVKQLNGFLRKKCKPQTIQKVDLQTISGKTIAVDTSIYLYRFMSENALMENMYLLISILLSYNITPIFIFDGKPPPEKYELLKRRRLAKTAAEHQYNTLHELLTSNPLKSDQKNLSFEMDQLRQQFVRIRESDISMVRDLMNAYGVSYYNAPGEADQVCAHLVRTGKAYACLSDDMDMFLYGCPRVLRNLSLLNKTILHYDTDSILNDLNLNEKQFRELMILSGTDYTTNIDTFISIETVYHLYQQYIQSNNSTQDVHFYTWLSTNAQYIYDVQELNHIYAMFESDAIYNAVPDIDKINISKSVMDIHNLTSLLTKEGFIFAGISCYQ